MSASFPDGAEILLARGVRVLDGGAALIGGSPTRLLRLSTRAQGRILGRRLVICDAVSRALADRLIETGMANPDQESLPDLIAASQVTFVIPAFGRAEQLDRLLGSIPREHPVIVVDDASPDAAPIAQAAARHGARLVRRETNGGPGQARNSGLAEATTEYVAFADTDTVVDSRAIRVLLRHFADPAVALVAPRIRALDARTGENWIERYEAARSSLDLGPNPGLVRPGTPIAWVPAAMLIARRAALAEGFTPGMRLGEDVDLVWRLAGAGFRVRYEPRAIVRHEHRGTIDGWLGRKLLYGSSATDLAKRHGDMAAPAVFSPWSAVLAVALVAQRRWSVPVAAAAASIATARIGRRLTGIHHPYFEGALLVAQGAASMLEQTMALTLRHWWPISAATAAFSPRTRRLIAVAAVTDSAVEYLRTRPRLDPLRFAVARRLDDLAYGLGVWRSAWRARSPVALLPRIVTKGVSARQAGGKTDSQRHESKMRTD